MRKGKLVDKGKLVCHVLITSQIAERRHAPTAAQSAPAYYIDLMFPPPTFVTLSIKHTNSISNLFGVPGYVLSSTEIYHLLSRYLTLLGDELSVDPGLSGSIHQDVPVKC